MAFLKDKPKRKKVNYSELLSQRDKLVILFPQNIADQYQLFRICAGWSQFFKRFVFVIPFETKEFFSYINNFENVEFYDFQHEDINYNNALIMDFSKDKLQKQKILSAGNSILISPENIGNIHFVPPILDPKLLMEKFCEFFQIPVQNADLKYDFSNANLKLLNNEFYSNKFMNFTINVDKDFPNDKIKELIVIVKQNFPANCYLVGKELKKHEFINFKNLSYNNFFDLFKIAYNSDIFLNTTDCSARIIAPTDVKQIYINRLPLEDKIPYINPINLTNLHNQIQNLIDKE